MSSIQIANVEVGVQSRTCQLCLLSNEGRKGTLRADRALVQEQAVGPGSAVTLYRICSASARLLFAVAVKEHLWIWNVVYP